MVFIPGEVFQNMKNVILLIDGENFCFKLEEVFASKQIKMPDISKLNLNKLTSVLSTRLKFPNSIETRYYTAKIHSYKQTKNKSEKLIARQRRFKNSLEKQGVCFEIAGNVRLLNNSKKNPVFKEKGVDVKIAVDMVSFGYKKSFDTIILCSSDSDLQPAIKEAKSQGLKIIYLGFKIKPNKGLIYTTDKTILLNNKDVFNLFHS